MENLVVYEKRDQVAWLTMNRPDALNALDENMKGALIDALSAAEFDDDVRVVVIRGSGKHFQAGGDIVSFHNDVTTMSAPELKQRFMGKINRSKLLLSSIRRMPKPVVAAVHGQAVGFGLSFAALCDFTIATESAKFALAYVRIGNSPDGASSYILPRAIGLKKATELAMLGDSLSATEAREYGLVNFVVADGALAEETDRLVARLAKSPTRALASIKKLMHASFQNSWDDQLQMEAECFVGNVTSDDFREALTSFVERRPAKFTGQ